MKHRDLIRALKELGWYKLREGGNHEIWTNGKQSEPVPRHPEVNEMLAKKIIKNAKKFNEENRK